MALGDVGAKAGKHLAEQVNVDLEDLLLGRESDGVEGRHGDAVRQTGVAVQVLGAMQAGKSGR